MTTGFERDYLKKQYDKLPGNILIYRMDSSEEILYVNHELLSMIGCSSEEEFFSFTGGRIKGFVREEDYTPAFLDIQAQLDRGSCSYSHISFRLRNRAHAEITVENFGRVLVDPEVGSICVSFLVASGKDSESLLADPLTGLMSMHRFQDVMMKKIGIAAQRGDLRKYSLIFFDMTNFKLFNLKYGVAAGDRSLCQMAEILKSVYEKDLVARFADDHFVVLTERPDITESILVVNIKVSENDISAIIHLKAGVRHLRAEDDSLSAAMLCDQAKIACDSIKQDASTYICEYNEHLKRQVELKTYVNDKIESALANGYIKIYYQPVIRSLTGKICGVEALARWEDPDYGFLSPGEFIPFLEEAHMIHMLDNYVIHEVGRQMRIRIDNNQPVVPCSFNLSRVDFLMGDPYEEVENVIRKFGLQRKLFRVEITESMIMQDKKRILHQVNRFRESGYEVWMDDFGSGYSSLNTLKEFSFNEIKIDMHFLRDLNEKGRHIITAMVDMAKKLGVHTLAEGVEYEEQAEFLKSIGCEKMQGYYYGKPMSSGRLSEFCRMSGTEYECELDEYIQDRVGLEDLNTDAPVALIEDDGKVFRVLFENSAFRETVNTMKTTSMEDVNEIIRSPYFALNKSFREMVERQIASGRQEKMTFIENGQYMCMTARTIAGKQGYYIHKVGLYNITYDDAQGRARRNDEIIRNIAIVYSGIYLWNPQEGEIETIATDHTIDTDDAVICRAEKFRQRWMQELIYPEDRLRFAMFFLSDTIYRRIRIERKGNTSDVFRFRMKNGNYEWMEVTACILQQSGLEEILLLLKPAAIEEYMEKADVITGIGDMHNFDSEGREWQKDGELWRALMENSKIKYFWKDRQGRFVGVNNAFLDFYGMESAQEVLGKTDGDLKWNTDGERFRDSERRVIERGESIHGAVGDCMAKGRIHKIITHKFPLYRDGKIDGLIGYFEDLDSIQWENYATLYLHDPLTGMMNFRGALDAGSRFEENYRKYGENYIGVLIDVPEYNHFFTVYGAEAADALTRFIAGKITENTDTGAAIARHSECRFQIYEKGSDTEDMRERMQKLEKELLSVHEIDGYKCTLYMNYSIAVGSEVSTTASLLRVLMERMDFRKNEDPGRVAYTGDRLVFDLEKFDDMTERIYMCDPDTYELVYLNQTGRRDLHLNKDFSCAGHKCYEVLEGREEPCEFCTIPVTRRDFFHTWTNHNQKSGRDYLMRDTLVPWRGKNYRFSMAVDLSAYIQEDERQKTKLYRSIVTNDVVSLALQAQNPEVSIQKMLEKIGQALGTERVFIFEHAENDCCSATYEWNKAGLVPMSREWQNVPERMLKKMYEIMERKKAFVIRDVRKMEKIHKLAPELYWKMVELQIRELICLELKSGGKTVGFFGVINPTKTSACNAEKILLTLSRYISIFIRNRDMVKRLDLLGSRDALTGVMNRRAFRDVARNMNENASIAVIYGDVNGLKMLNDTKGHDAGDELIKATADVMSAVVGSDHVFRMGGDEFLIVVEMDEKVELDQMMQKLRDGFDKEGISVALGSVYHAGVIKDVDELMHEADRRMYINKQSMHEQDH